MKYIKNIWSVYYLVLILSILILVGQSYSKHQTLHERLNFQQSSTLTLLSKAIESNFTQTELILDILSATLVDNELYKDPDAVDLLLKKMQKTNPNLFGFAFINPQGKIIAISQKIDPSKIPSLLSQEETKAEFKATLASNKMVFGRNYYFEAIQNWILPARKTIRDHEGTIIGVISTAIKVGAIQKNIGFAFTSDTDKKLTIINSLNGYKLFVSRLPINQYKRTYQTPIATSELKPISKGIQRRYGISLNQATSLLPDTPLNINDYTQYNHITNMEKPQNTTLLFNKKYSLWLKLDESLNALNSDFFTSLALYFLFFLFIHIILIWTVMRISGHELGTHKALVFRSEHDTLTGLYNRNYLEKTFQPNLSQAKETISLMFIDLDHFKHINDTFGHSMGDQLLIQVASRLKSFLDERYILIRFGGDEFVVILNDQSTQDMEIAKQLIETISVSYLINGLNFTIGASIGIARENVEACNLDTLLSHADLAMYEAKKYRNYVEVFSDSLQYKSQYAASIEHQLRSAIDHQEIYMHYQPQVNTQGELHGVECLVRWNNASLGFVSPDQFIKVAENMGIMPRLGDYITQTALTEMAHLQKTLNQRFQISINISLKQFIDETFFDNFIKRVTASQIPFKYITIEVTESLFIEDIDYILSMLDQFRRKGIAVSLDDFGTGYSSLSLLRQLPIQELKIDKAFVDDILDDLKDANLVKNIINIADDLGMYTLAEGVETAAQLHKLAEMNCDLYQGYYFSKPLSAADLSVFINQCTLIKQETLKG